MSTSLTTTAGTPETSETDFSLVLGGPLFQLWRRAHLCGDALELLRRRILLLATIAWLPLLVLSAAEGHAWGTSVGVPFLYDMEIHVRLLLALPLLVAAEMIVHRRIRPVVQQFVRYGLIPESQRSRFDAAISSAIRLRNSVAAELLLVGVVYVVGVGFVWRTHLAFDVASWSGTIADGRSVPSLAGWWLMCVSLPMIQFLILRWYFRMFVWARFLWQVSRIDLSLMPTHPDRRGGLGFLSSISYASAPVLVAQGALLAGMIADRIFYAGAKLPDFKMEMVGLVTVALFAVLAPLLAFYGQLASAKRETSREYGVLAQRYVRDFDRKWVRGGAPSDEQLLGSGDIQSLADLNNSYESLRSMKLFPSDVKTAGHLAAATLLPVLPLILTMMPLEELLLRLCNLVL